MMRRAHRVGNTHTPLLYNQSRVLKARHRVGLLIGETCVHLVEGLRLSLGTDASNHVVVDEMHVSSRHCVVEWSSNRVQVTDLGSTNGTWFQGVQRPSFSLDVGQVFFLGRHPVLVVEMSISERYPNAGRWQGMIFTARSSGDLLSRVAVASAHQVPTLILGETGCGKERVAAAIHATSSRRGGPWVAINCASLPTALAESELFGAEQGAFTGAKRARKGAFERAHGGTLFLDEVGELAPSVQSTLLRVLETRQVTPVGGSSPRTVDVKIIAATWRDLSPSSPDPSFRQDLYQRLCVLPIHVSPLRARVDEIGPLMEMFFRERALESMWPTPPVLRALETYAWPGNVRELRNRVIRSACSGAVSDLLPGLDPGPNPPLKPSQAGKRPFMVAALRRHGGNRSAAARSLGISRSTLYRWMESFDPEALLPMSHDLASG